MKTIASFSIKGGVGKTASAVNLAYLAAHMGRRTLLVDLDAQGAASFYFRVRAGRSLRGKHFFEAKRRLYRAIRASDYDRLDVLAAHRSFRNFDIVLDRMKKPQTRLTRLLRFLANDYDLAVLDCPPNASRLSEAVCRASDLVLVPVIPSTLSERAFEHLIDFVTKMNLPRKKLCPFFSMVQARKRLHAATIRTMREQHPSFLHSMIPHAAQVERMGVERQPLPCYAAQSEPARAYREFAAEVLARVDGKRRAERRSAA